MALFNTSEKFGALTRLLHWSFFVLFIAQFFLVYRREYFPENAPEKLQYILLHKSLGVLVLALAFIMIIVRHIGKRPAQSDKSSAFENSLAKITHILLYLLLLAMPITGILMSSYAGYGVSFFGVYKLPLFVEKSEEMAKLFHEVHEWLSYGIIGVVGLHIIGALKHHLIYKDNVLKRMSPLA